MRKPRLLDTRNLSTESMEPTLDSGRATNIDSSAQKLPFGHMGRHPDYAFQAGRDKPIGGGRKLGDTSHMPPEIHAVDISNKETSPFPPNLNSVEDKKDGPYVA